MSVYVQDILDKFPKLLSFSAGNNQARAKLPCSAEHPQKESIAYAPQKEQLVHCVDTGCNIIVIPKGLDSQSVHLPQSTALLTTSNLSLAMALVNQEFFPIQENQSPFDQQDIHPSAVISKDVVLGNNCKIGPNAVIYAQAHIGDHCVIGANVVIEQKVQIGVHCHIHPLSFIGHNCVLGQACVIHPNTTIGSEGFGFASDQNFKHYRKPHYGRVILEDRVEVGAGVQIDRGAYQDTVIGEGTKIDNHCHIAHNFKTGKDCLITAGFITAGSASIGDRCVFGGRSSVNGHIQVCNDVTAAGMSVISNNVTEAGTYGGWPLQKMKDSLKTLMASTHLPKMRKQISQIMHRLDM